MGVVAGVDEEAGGENVGLEFLSRLPPVGLRSSVAENSVASEMCIRDREQRGRVRGRGLRACSSAVAVLLGRWC